jgi:hypothetical protein
MPLETGHDKRTFVLGGAWYNYEVLFFSSEQQTACSVGWWLMAGAGSF